MSWNYRMLAHQDEDGDVVFKVHEVYMDDDRNLTGYAENPATATSDRPDTMWWVLEKMNHASYRTALWHGDRFPEEYKP